MSQVISIKPVEADVLARFLDAWNRHGSAEAMDECSYTLVPRNGSNFLLEYRDNELSLEGRVSSKAAEILSSLSEAEGVDLFLESEPLEAPQGLEQWESWGPLGKVLGILGLIVLAPIALLLLPVFLLVAVIRLVFTLWKHERSVP